MRNYPSERAHLSRGEIAAGVAWWVRGGVAKAGVVRHLSA